MNMNESNVFTMKMQSTYIFSTESRNDNDNSLLVPTASGYIKGIDVDDDVQAWLGIPYAEPPKGNL